MKKKFTKIGGATLKAFALSIALIALMVLVLSPAAQATTTAANTKIINNARASYNDGTGTQYTPYSSVTVTVSLVSAAPSVAILSGNATTAYTGTDTPVLNNTFTVTATSNGLDTYTLTPNKTGDSNTTGGSFGTLSPASPIQLGATTVLSYVGGTKTFTVPSDGNSDGKINGIDTTSTVVINGEVHTIASITDNASGTSTIVLNTAMVAAVAAGDLIAEQKTITVPVKPGTISANGTSITVTKTLTVKSGNGSGPAQTSGSETDTWTNGLISFKKYVRNTATTCNTGNSVTFKTIKYCDAGVTGNPIGSGSNYTLEYLMVITNSGTGSVSAAKVTDTLPTEYVNYVAGSIVYYDESDNPHAVSDTSGNDNGNWTSPTITVNVGGVTPPVDSGPGGNIAAGATVHVSYQVTII